MGKEVTKHLNILLLTLPGTPITYYGEEIGMQNIQVSYDDTQDPFGRNYGKERYREVSRDPCRSPMQWNSEKHAGFSNSTKTWLPVHPGYKALNVEVCHYFHSFQPTLMFLYHKRSRIAQPSPTSTYIEN